MARAGRRVALVRLAWMERATQARTRSTSRIYSVTAYLPAALLLRRPRIVRRVGVVDRELAVAVDLDLDRLGGADPMVHARGHGHVIALGQRSRIARIDLVAHAVGQGPGGGDPHNLVGRVMMRRNG